MVYVLLDTNIILDMVVDRRNNLSDNLLKSFIKLLDYGEVKLIVPAVVKTETCRHLDNEFENVGRQIESVMDSIKDLYGISTYRIDPLDLSEYKKKARAELCTAQTQFQKYKGDYQKDIRDTIDLLFTHNNTIAVDDESLMAKIQKRRVHKKAPFHKEGKESYGDGAITETLINIKRCTDIKAEDKIFFVTGNYKDFSDKDDKTKLHSDIVEDLKMVGLDSNVVYVESFGKLVCIYLKDNLENANLIEEFEAEMREEEKNFYRDIDDNLRESAGLTALGSFVTKLEESIPESEFASAMVEFFGRLNIAYRKTEEFYDFFEYELNVDSLDCKYLVSRFFNIVGCENKTSVGTIRSILDWIENQKRECEVIEGNLPDFISPDEDVEFWDVKRCRYIFSISSLDYLMPGNGETDEIDIVIRDGDGQAVVRGTIDVAYGFIEEDPFDRVGNGCEECVEYNITSIVDAMKEFCEEWESFIKEKEEIMEKIKNVMTNEDD